MNGEQPGNERWEVDYRSRTRARGGALPSDWRVWLLSATVRAGVATGFLLTPTVRIQLGEAAIAALSLFIGIMILGVMAGHWYIVRRTARRDLAADAFAVIALAPSAIVAAGIQGADDRFGGRTANVLAALGATILIFAIVALIAGLDDRLTFGDASIGALGGALTLAVLVGNPERYPSGEAWQALSIAWMAAALATAMFGFMPSGARSALPVAVYALFALAVILIPVNRPNEETGVETLSVLALIVAGAIIVLVAPAGSRAYVDDA